MTSLRTALAAALVATGTLVSSFSPALAGDPSFGIYFDGHGGGGAVLGVDGIEVGIGFGHGGGGGIVIDGAKCSKFEALHKAASLGVYNRYVKSVGSKHIVVRGKLGGDKVEVVMKRKSAHCTVKDVYYI